MFQKLADDPDFYGVLRPRAGSGLRMKSIDQHAALLFLTLRESGTLPAYIFSEPTDGVESSIAQLVLDGVLELEVGDGFVSGPAAHSLLDHAGGHEDCDGGPAGSLAQISRAAVKYAAALDITNAVSLSVRLYSYHRIPISGYWRRRLPHTAAVRDYWGLGGRTCDPESLGWEPIPTPASQRSWLTWRSPRPAVSYATSAAAFKLYVSPHPDHAKRALAETVGVLGAVGAPCFKIGADLAGLLRPDKIVCYFPDRDQLQQAADLLATATDGMPAHGVPFTGELGGSGLISWGVDPSAGHEAFGWLGRQSWRLWITNHLAVNILAAKAQPSADVSAWRFALNRLRLEGVDCDTWTPRADVPLSFLSPDTDPRFDDPTGADPARRAP